MLFELSHQRKIKIDRTTNISYHFQPSYIDGKFEIWNTNRKYRIMNSPLVGDWDNQFIIQN